MIRKLTFAALAAALLGGCVSTGYQYRDGPGDYYYGRSASAYGPYGAPYGRIGYGYPGGLYGSVGYGYGYPYDRYSRYYGGYSRYGYYPYGHPYYYSPYYYPRPVIVRPRHGHGHTPPPPDQHDHDRDKRRPPWRDLADPDLADLRRRRSDTPQPSQPFVTGAVSPPPPRFVERPEPRLRMQEPEPRTRSRDRDDTGTETP